MQERVSNEELQDYLDRWAAPDMEGAIGIRAMRDLLDARKTIERKDEEYAVLLERMHYLEKEWYPGRLYWVEEER